MSTSRYALEISTDEDDQVRDGIDEAGSTSTSILSSVLDTCECEFYFYILILIFYFVFASRGCCYSAFLMLRPQGNVSIKFMALIIERKTNYFCKSANLSHVIVFWCLSSLEEVQTSYSLNGTLIGSSLLRESGASRCQRPAKIYTCCLETFQLNSIFRVDW